MVCVVWSQYTPLSSEGERGGSIPHHLKDEKSTSKTSLGKCFLCAMGVGAKNRTGSLLARGGTGEGKRIISHSDLELQKGNVLKMY